MVSVMDGGVGGGSSREAADGRLERRATTVVVLTTTPSEARPSASAEGVHFHEDRGACRAFGKAFPLDSRYDAVTLGAVFEDVLAAAQANAPWAFERLYRAYAAPVAGYLRLQGAPDADDVVSETFVSAFSAISRFHGGEASFRSWLFTIAHRRLVDAWRQAGRRPPVADDDVSGFAGGDVEDDVAARLGTERVQRLVSALAPDQREVLLLRVVADLSVEQVAEALGKSEGAVKALQRRGLAALRREISPEGVPL